MEGGVGGGYRYKVLAHYGSFRAFGSGELWEALGTGRCCS